MGFALARAGVRRGWDVVLVAGPVHLATPVGVRRVDVETAEDMLRAVREEASACDVAVFAAAVADFRPVAPAQKKIKKSAGLDTLRLEPTTDILAAMRGEIGFRGVLVGFAAETENLLAHAWRKLRAKGCDMIVGNDVSRVDIGFGQESNEVVILRAGGKEECLPKMSKDAVADAILDRAERNGAVRDAGSQA